MRLRICLFALAVPVRAPSLLASPAFQVPYDPGEKIQVTGTVTFGGGHTYEMYGVPPR